ncbi:YesL family protein [Gracilibacillus caseinilyticus]|uniref:YesL family protein n=1 Tax=Gracilibacillus caseinilyticus TaxID=2932256 RepID=A0ABY4EWF7_9BACI|nr:YesL family protein [Gracilibacillus caseinilyticus]UOQ48198.1 YesL family protein [Gracilibacillus caseinilyticus]
MNALNKAFEWISKMAYLNVLWIGFTILGLFVAGLFPATAAVFAVTRKWITGYTDIPLFKTFWQSFRASFVQANILGYIFAAIAYVLYLDFVFITLAPNDFVMILTVPFLFVSILAGLTFLYVFPVYVHYKMRLLEVVKSAFFIMILNPLKTLIMMLGVFGITFILWHFQGWALFFSMSLISLAVMLPAQKAFEKIQEKKVTYDDSALAEE